MTAEFTPFVLSALAAGSDAAVVAGAGHFLHLERPGEVGRRILGFLGA